MSQAEYHAERFVYFQNTADICIPKNNYCTKLLLMNKYIKPLHIFFLIFLLLLSVNSFSQEPGNNDIPVVSIIESIERTHSITVFYKDEWLTGNSADQSIAHLPAEEALAGIARLVGLRLVKMGDLFFILPGEPSRTEQISITDDLIQIGSQMEFGRYSRARIQGKVLNAVTQEPLFGAVIYEPQTESGVSTNFDGLFEITLPVGDYQLRISYLGFEEKTQRVRLISHGEITLELFEGTTQLDEFVITAHRAEDNIRRTQMSLVSLDAKALQELPGAFGEQDIVRSFTLMPGIQTIGEFGSGFNVRGGSADQNLILVENVPLFNSSHLFGLISVINPDMVREVTLMKAGIPARYGERASSVMDIRLGNGTDIERTSLEGGIGLINSRLHLETPIIKEKATFAMGLRSSYSDFLLQRIPNEDLMNSSVGFYDISALSAVALGPRNRLTLFGYRSFDKSNFGDDVDYEYFNHLASLRLNSIINNRLSSAFVLGYSGYQYQLAETPEHNLAGHYLMNSDIDYRSLRWHLSYFPGKSHAIEFGVQAIQYIIEPGSIEGLGENSNIQQRKIEAEKGIELAAFISDEIIIGDRVSMELGLRYSHYFQLGPAIVRKYESDRAYSFQSIIDTKTFEKDEVVAEYSGLEPRFGFRVGLSEQSSVKLSYNRAYQYINLISNTSVMAPADLWKLSDTYLQPLKSDQFALGYFRNFMDNNIETSIEVYYKQIHNAIEYRSGAQIAMNEYLEMDVINARGYNYGIELYLRKQAGNLTGFASYTYSSAQRRSHSPFPAMQINNNTYFPSNYDRPHNLTLNANLHLSRRWRLSGTFTYNTGRPITLPDHAFYYGNDLLVQYSDRNAYRLPDYHRLDISISLGENLRVKQRGKGSWTLSILNVYGRKNPFSVFYKKDPQTIRNHSSYELYQLYIIGRPLPTITYSFSL